MMFDGHLAGVFALGRWSVWLYHFEHMWHVRNGHGAGDFGLSWFRWSTVALGIALLAFSAALLFAQATHGAASKEPGSLIHSPLPPVPDDRVTGPDAVAVSRVAADESCFLWPLTGVGSPTAGVASLDVPGQARKDFQRACKAASDKRL